MFKILFKKRLLFRRGRNWSSQDLEWTETAKTEAEAKTRATVYNCRISNIEKLAENSMSKFMALRLLRAHERVKDAIEILQSQSDSALAEESLQFPYLFDDFNAFRNRLKLALDAIEHRVNDAETLVYGKKGK